MRIDIDNALTINQYIMKLEQVIQEIIKHHETCSDPCTVVEDLVEEFKVKK